MKTKSAMRSEVETALEQGRKRLREFERERGVMLPPPAPGGREAEAALREHFFALLHAGGDPDLYSGILQHLLHEHTMPIPSGVFKRRFYDPPTSTALSPDGEPKPIFGSKIGRPSKADEAWPLAHSWLDFCHERSARKETEPTFGQFYLHLNPGAAKGMSPRELKKQADKIRQQIYSVLPPSEKSRK
jgi:hypothetical protein